MEERTVKPLQIIILSRDKPLLVDDTVDRVIMESVACLPIGRDVYYLSRHPMGMMSVVHEMVRSVKIVYNNKNITSFLTYEEALAACKEVNNEHVSQEVAEKYEP